MVDPIRYAVTAPGTPPAAGFAGGSFVPYQAGAPLNLALGTDVAADEFLPLPPAPPAVAPAPDLGAADAAPPASAEPAAALPVALDEPASAPPDVVIDDGTVLDGGDIVIEPPQPVDVLPPPDVVIDDGAVLGGGEIVIEPPQPVDVLPPPDVVIDDGAVLGGGEIVIEPPPPVDGPLLPPDVVIDDGVVLGNIEIPIAPLPSLPPVIALPPLPDVVIDDGAVLDGYAMFLVQPIFTACICWNFVIDYPVIFESTPLAELTALASTPVEALIPAAPAELQLLGTVTLTAAAPLALA